MKKCIPIILLAGIVFANNLTAHPIIKGATFLLEVKKQAKGKVVDASGKPIVGATVRIKGTSIGTSTNENGEFQLEYNDDEKITLTISSVGFTTKDFVVQNTQNIIITLDNKNDLDEVVIVGYGTQKKVNLTGAVSQVTSEVLENRPSPSLSRMLQGQLPNLNLKMVDGSPTRGATFNIRGTTSIGAGGSALVLIDGVEGDPNQVNPNDIESVTELKDASSAAIYGSRAAFGVVLITTKNPTKGATKIDFNTNYSFNQRTVEPKLITNGYQWAQNFNDAFNAWYDYKSTPISVNNIYPFSLEYLEALKNNNDSPSGQDAVFNPTKNRYEYFGNTDWYNIIYKDAMPATEQALAISGGGDKASYYLSGRYYHQEGIFKYNPDKFNKYNLRGKGDIKINEWLTFQNNTELSTYDYKYPMFSDGDGNIWRQFEHQGYPMAVIHNPDGTYTHTAVYTGVASFMEGDNVSNQTNTYLRNTAGAIIKPLAGLTIKGDFTFSKTWENDIRTNNYMNYSNAPGETSRFGRSLLRNWNENTKYLAGNITANYVKKINDKHDINALIGYNVETSTSNNLRAQRDGILVPEKPDFNLTDGLNYGITGGGNEWAYLGLFYRLNYAYDNKYLLELNGRYDGSSKFPAHQRFGFFPSVSAGWIVSNEEFFTVAKPAISNLKFRASYGSLGNGNVAPYRYLEQMSVGKTSVILNGVQSNYTRLPGVIPDGLTWEKSTTFNAGVDVGFFANTLNIEFDWYNRMTYDMFTVGPPLPNTFGATVPFGNYADMSTKGWELTVKYNSQFELAGKPFNWGINGSLWDSKSTITRFNNIDSLLSSYYVGQTVGEIWGYTTLGFFATTDEIKSHADQSFIKNSNNNVWLPGDIKFADLNNDGVINNGNNTVRNPGDRKIIGNNAPRYQYGFTLSGNWNGIGVSAFFQGIGKRDWYFAPEAGLFWGPYNRPYGYQPELMMNDHWTEENPDAYFPRYRGYTALGTDRSLGAPQTKYLQDVSYLRLKTLTIDYMLPRSVTQRMKIAKAQIFASAQNLVTFSKLFKHTENFDPEVMENPVGDLTNGSGQGYAYPMLKTTTIGLNLTF